MSRKTYTNPLIFLASPGTDIHNSHEGGGGVDWEPTTWEKFIESLGEEGWTYVSDDFDPNAETWTGEVDGETIYWDRYNPDTWDSVIIYE